MFVRAHAVIVAMAWAFACGGSSCSPFEPETGGVVLACVDADSDPATPVNFHRDIRPMMDRLKDDPAGPGCRACHYASEASHAGIDLGGLNLETLGALRKGGITSGPNILVPSKPCSSVIVQKLRGTYPFGPQMPKESPREWNATEIQLVVDWIAEGALGGDAE